MKYWTCSGNVLDQDTGIIMNDHSWMDNRIWEGVHTWTCMHGEIFRVKHDIQGELKVYYTLQTTCQHLIVWALWASLSAHSMYKNSTDVSVWVRWWMFFVYAFAAWLLCTLCLTFLYIYRRCTAKKKAPAPVAAVNTNGKKWMDEWKWGI